MTIGAQLFYALNSHLTQVIPLEENLNEGYLTKIRKIVFVDPFNT